MSDFYCDQCGVPVLETDEFCPYCGERFEEDDNKHNTRVGFIDRAFPAFLDNLILNISLRLLFLFIPVWSGLSYVLLLNFILLSAVYGYFAVFAYMKKGQTLGKMLNNIKVVDLAGEDISLSRFLLRETIARGVPFIASLFIGYGALLWILTYMLAWSKDRRALHDYIAGTQVIEVPPPEDNDE